MISYYTEFLITLLPRLSFTLLSIAPLIVGVIGVWRKKKRGWALEYNNYIVASILCGLVTLMFLWSSLFGDALSSSSTAGLIFAVVPFYGLIVLLVSLGIGKLVIFGMRIREKKGDENPVARKINRVLIYIPSAILAILLAGVVKLDVGGNDVAIAEGSQDPQVLHYLYSKAIHGDADKFAILLFMAQNPNAPTELLEQMAKSEYPQIRVFVASNRNTSEQVRRSLEDDEVDCVARTAKKSPCRN